MRNASRRTLARTRREIGFIFQHHNLLDSSGLQPSEVELVMQLAQASLAGRHGAGSGEPLFTDEQRRHLLASLHAVAAADGDMGPEERAEIEAIAQELGLGLRPTD